MYFSALVKSQVPRTWNLKYLRIGLFLSLLNTIFGFFTPQKLTHTKFQDEMIAWTIVITEKIQNSRFYPGTPILVIFSILNNLGTVRSWGLKFPGIDHFKTIYKKLTNEQNLGGKGVMPWMIWHGITLNSIMTYWRFYIGNYFWHDQLCQITPIWMCWMI